MRKLRCRAIAKAIYSKYKKIGEGCELIGHRGNSIGFIDRIFTDEEFMRFIRSNRVYLSKLKEQSKTDLRSGDNEN